MAWVGPLLGSNRSSSQAGPAAVGRDSFQALLHEWAPRVELQVTDLLGGGTLDVDLQIHDLRDFRPERVVASVAQLQGLASARGVVERLGREPLAIDTLGDQLIEAGADAAWARSFQKRIEASRKPEGGHGRGPLSGSESGSGSSRGTAPRESLDRLFDLVDLPGGTPTSAGTGGTLTSVGTSRVGVEEDLFRALVERLGGSSGRRRGAEKEIASETLRILDATLGAQLASILHHPDFVQLETAWRGLKFLVDRTDFKKGIELEVLATSKEDFPILFEERIFTRECDQAVSPPLVAVWADFEIDATSRDIEMLSRIGAMADDLQVPVVAAAGPAFFGLETLRDLEGQSPFWDFFAKPEFIPFTALCKKPFADSLALALPRMMARLPHGASNPTRGMEWDEAAHSTWSRAGWSRPLAAVASAASGSHAEHGWPADIVGGLGSGRIRDLPVTIRDGAATGPLEVALGESVAEELAESGFIVLASPPRQDVAIVAHAPMLSRMAHRGGTDEERRTRSLPYRMTAALVAGVVRRLASELRAARSPVEIRKHFEEGLASSLEIREEGRLAVAVEPSPEAAGRFGVGIHVRLPVVLMGDEVAMDLALEVGG